MPLPRRVKGKRTTRRGRSGSRESETPGLSGAGQPGVTYFEYGLLSLIDLTQGLTPAVDLFRAADALLLNLMGQLGTTRATLWLVSDEPPGRSALIRGHGLRPGEAETLSELCAEPWLLAVRRLEVPLTKESSGDPEISKAAVWLAQSDFALVAPIRANGALLGMAALGSRADGSEYGSMEVELLMASLGIAGVALQNSVLHNRLLESGRQLRIANEERDHLRQGRDEFLSNVNHELRTPLSVIVPALEHVLESDLGTDDLRTLLGHSVAQARRLVAIVENLLTLSEIGRETLSLRVAEQDVGAFLNSYHAERLPGVSAGLREFILPGTNSPVWGRYDDQRLRQILDALVDNAVKFTPPGSHIVLAADSLIHEGESWARIRVEDDGPGIPPEKLGRLFEPFRQLDGSLTRKVGGLGIGLALARDLADRMGGRVVAVSDYGKGATFSVLLKTGSG